MCVTDLKPAAANEDIDSDYDEDGDLKSTSIASNVESDSDYDNDDDEDLKTGGDGDEDLMTGGNLKTGGDLLEEPTAKIIKKKIPGGAFSPRCESLGILQNFISKQVLPLFAARLAEQDASSPTGGNHYLVQEEGGGQYDDDELFQDNVEEEEDMEESVGVLFLWTVDHQGPTPKI